ncbi:S10 family peptidase [Actinokineospora bangkokensis]|uniref:Peptidase S10 n=1 Tax=Actinokineospora bangkokensis TaxID=1193682 RepID=A0A1Q9LDA0_9PSEU|nr:peptidase S10 [Actinokineospora bangkokensis]OLR90011.1 peptidase S10 [Actinokineospora bangkokensis]
MGTTNSDDAGSSSTPEPVDDLVTTGHSLTVRRRKLNYTATTGRVVLRREVVTDGKVEGYKPKAEVLLTAYTLDGADPGQRPVTFAFNGGPGSASVWLHLGVLGPRRVVSGDAGAPVQPPYTLVDNPDTLLVHSDLVFIDPVGTGMSRATTGEKSADFHTFTADLEHVAEVIRLWTTRNGRWLSPKFLAGESYGTTRAAALAEHLQDKHGMYLNGLMLISAVLDFGTILFNEGNDRAHALYLPTYTAIAHHHGLLGDRPLADALAEAEEFADRDYPWALARGARLTPEERAATITKLAGLTGLSEDYLDRVDMRVEHIRFFTELLRHRKLTVGRFDGRFTGWESDYGRERFTEDPASAAIMGPFTAGINHYLREELGYPSDLHYQVLSTEVFRQWSYKEFQNAHVSVTDKLAAAMRGNPALKIHVASGYLDGATPYYATEHVLAALRIPAELRENIEVKYYEAGHMMYLHEPSRVQQGKDLGAFVKASSNR